jgi:hypothetical protein
MMQPRQRLGWRLNFAPTKGSSLSEEHTGLSAAVCINSSILLGVNEGSDISCAAAWNILIAVYQQGDIRICDVVLWH